MKDFKILVSYSGGKDSLASLIWAINESGYKKENIQAVFCDTGWEHQDTYKHIEETTKALDVPLVVLKSKKYDGLVDLSIKKGRFPSTLARFCTEELKTKPMIDYVLDDCGNSNVVVIQGIRKDESHARSKMSKQCSFFKYYTEPYGHDKHGKPKFHKYRKKDVLKFREKNLDDVLRPIFDWTAQETLEYILQSGLKPNPLYYKGMGRVGCYPCIMANLKETKNIMENDPKYLKRLIDAEKEVGRTFFPPNFIPDRYQRTIDPKSGKRISTVEDVARYIADRNADGELFPESEDHRSCMSYYVICE